MHTIPVHNLHLLEMLECVAVCRMTVDISMFGADLQRLVLGSVQF